MSNSIHTPEHKELIGVIIRHRHAAGLTQEHVSKAIGQHQSYVAKLETGQRRLDIVEYLAIARAIGFDPAAELQTIAFRFGYSPGSHS
ncbi:helix-turn-helix domain-containing protein [Shinella sp. M31]|uniref:helix-turn-helix domain-containing protein n=1 Tax=Shinella sp. M31 TaxID=3368615 RepID=UPI003B9F2BFE